MAEEPTVTYVKSLEQECGWQNIPISELDEKKVYEVEVQADGKKHPMGFMRRDELRGQLERGLYKGGRVLVTEREPTRRHN